MILGGSFGMAGKFPDNYMSAQMIGQAIGGVFPALVDISIVALHVKEEDVGSACFTIATVVLIICLVSLRWAFQTEFFKHYYYHQHDSQVATEDDNLQTKPSVCTVVKHCWIYLISIFLTFTITLTVFPSVAVLVQSETYKSESSWAIDYFTPVCVFLLFNVGDLIGRSLASWIKLPGRSALGKGLVLVLSVSRIAFIPLFMYCNIVTEKSSERNVLFASDADFIAFMTLFAVSNGYLGNICMLNGPKSSNDKEMQEAIALILIAGLVLGTGAGSAISYPLVSIL